MSPSHLALLLLLLLATSTHATPVTITTTYGPVTGTSSSSSTNITTFYGIPFAAPPLGELRFKPPQPPTPWSRPVVATNPDTPMCMQDVNSGSEDCLTLDIYTPTTNPQANLSVMMWIYGGGFTSGDDYENGRFSGLHMAQTHNVVVVAANYRVGALGFLALPELQQEDPHHRTGNAGTLDQTAALSWVAANIARFGGNPGSVTIFGESAGGFSVCWHLVSPSSRGLFHGAIMESGSCDSKSFFYGTQEAFAFGARWATSVGCPSGSLACLRALSPQQVLNSSLTHFPAPSQGGGGAAQPPLPPAMAPIMPWGPVIDGTSLTALPLTSLAAGDFAAVPTVFGTNKNEGTIFVPAIAYVSGANIPPTTSDMETKVLPHFFRHYSSNATAIATAAKAAIARYPLEAYEGSLTRRAAAVLTDWFFTCGTQRAAKAIAKAGGRVWLYQFTIELPWANYPALGDFHSSEVVFVFNTPTKTEFFNAPCAKLSAAMQSYWTSVSTHGDPNGGNGGTLEAWPKYEAASEWQSMNLTWPLAAVKEVEESRCQFWKDVFEKLL